jgi:DNA invertase Pin-like site-specific DNA recombinase
VHHVASATPGSPIAGSSTECTTLATATPGSAIASRSTRCTLDRQRHTWWHHRQPLDQVHARSPAPHLVAPSPAARPGARSIASATPGGTFAGSSTRCTTLASVMPGGIAASYIENESGAKLARPELFRLLADSKPGDILLIEQVDRLSRLTDGDWRRLRAELDARQVRVVALDLPTSWMLAASGDDFTSRMFAAVNAMMLDVLAAVARKDYEDRRRRQAQGQAKAKAEGRYKGRPEDAKRNSAIAAMLAKGLSWSEVQSATGCSRATIAKIAKRPAAA